MVDAEPWRLVRREPESFGMVRLVYMGPGGVLRHLLVVEALADEEGVELLRRSLGRGDVLTERAYRQQYPRDRGRPA